MEAESRGAAAEPDDRAVWDDLRERPRSVAAAAALLLFVWWLFWG
ncbi:MAG TPA: hypothetical protein VGE16_03070 [Albitalea sp.]